MNKRLRRPRKTLEGRNDRKSSNLCPGSCTKGAGSWEKREQEGGGRGKVPEQQKAA